MSSSGKILEGVLAINKPQGISSAQVLRDLQKHFNPSRLFAPYLLREQKSREAEAYNQRYRRSKAKRGVPQVKIGHGGTLDLGARGVLVTGIGKGTKELQKFLECTKTYETVVLFGAATESYDAEGKVVARKSFDHVKEEVVRDALGKFRGKIMQRPPIFSALRVEGRRMYEYAREGKELPVEIKERPVEVLDLELIEWMECGSHEHRWPEQQAEKEEKVMASQILHLDDNDAAMNKPDTLNSLGACPTGLKRKHEESEDDTIIEPDSEVKKLRQDSTALMPGALATPNDLSTNSESANRGTAVKFNVDRLDADQMPPAAKFRMTVTSGFYVRSFCHDLGIAVGSFALMSDLIRTRQAQFELGKNVLEYDDLAHGEDFWAPKVEDLLDKWSRNPQK